MTASRKSKVLSGMARGAALLLAGGIALAADSGFLPDYTKLQEVRDLNGHAIRQWNSPNLNRANYQKILIDKVTYYPAPKGSEQVSDQTLSDIQQYMDTQLRTVALKRIPQVTEPGPGVLRVKVAITAVDTSATGLKPWQIIPVALVIQGAKAATGNRPENSNLAVEALVTDSVSDEPLGMSVRAAHGAKLPNGHTQLTLDTVKSRIDDWAANIASLVDQKIAE
ncbi:MAG: DUF3313 domain-containing protein [Proteobacteria bacterium]|nr:DUF3313 domain-containing protein [Pseudomonadota bacterium]